MSSNDKTFNIKLQKGYEVSNTIKNDTTWIEEKSPYIITEPISIYRGTTLTIEPGVIVKFHDNTSIEATSDVETDSPAKLIIKGTSFSPVKFTSMSQTPKLDSWEGIKIDKNDEIENFIIEYAKNGIETIMENYKYYKVNTYKNIVVRYCETGLKGLIKIENGIIENCTIGSYPNYSSTGYSSIEYEYTNVLFQNNDYGIYSCKSGYQTQKIIIHDCSFENISEYGIYSESFILEHNIYNSSFKKNNIGAYLRNKITLMYNCNFIDNRGLAFDRYSTHYRATGFNNLFKLYISNNNGIYGIDETTDSSSGQYKSNDGITVLSSPNYNCGASWNGLNY
ncbi:MAG: hypothetical protein JXQ65_06030 [Candidatus Marinimicrobia bacterium]|nr:hypothetical protein [Candidatus Neomarinimicrobiota bacterium]